MSGVHFEKERRINDSAEHVYQYIANYREHHPNFLPSIFSDLCVERGGFGAGTAFNIQVTVAGRKQTMRMEVTEPEPGRVIMERDVETGTVTTFTVTPQGDTASNVLIHTVLQTPGGITGWLQRLFLPRHLGKMYVEELENLDRYARINAQKSITLAPGV